MNIQKLQRLVVDALEDIKAQDIKIFNTAHLTDLFERIVIVSGTSSRQTRALAHSVIDAVRKHNIEIIALEGEESGEWVLLDIGDIVIHCMQPAIRAYYDLESVWGGKPVRLKLLPQSTQPVMQNITYAPDDDNDSA